MMALASDLSVAWITARAAGIVALVAASLSVMLGLGLAGRLAKGPGKLGDVRVLHQTLGIATLLAMTIHTVALLFDPWLKASLSDLLVPFSMHQHTPLWTGLGTLAAYGFLVFGLSGFLRRRLGKRWAWIHRTTGVIWALAVLHTLGSGSDMSEPWMIALLVACTLPVGLLLAARVGKPGVWTHHFRAN